MNPNQMTYFNSLVLQHDFHDEARRSRQAEQTPDRPAQTRDSRSETTGRDHNILDRFHLALPGRR